MKKYGGALALAVLLGVTGVASCAPQRDDKRKPIVVDKMCYAQEVVEYESDEEEIQLVTDQTESDEYEESVSICVRGKSVLSILPDRATIYAVIENIDTDMKTSKDTNFSSFDGVVTALKDSGVDEEQICLQQFNCMPSYDYSNGKNLQGYMTTTAFTLKVDEIDNIKTYIDVMTENGVTTICNIQYEISTIEEEYASALSSAFENARAKAVKLLGNENIRLVKVREEMVFSSNNLCKSYVEGVDASLMGKVDIEASIFAEFETTENATSI